MELPRPRTHLTVNISRPTAEAFPTWKVQRILQGRFIPVKLQSIGLYGEVWYALPAMAVWHYCKSIGATDNLPQLDELLTSDSARALKDVSVKDLLDLSTYMCTVKLWYKSLPDTYPTYDAPEMQWRNAAIENRLDEIGAKEHFSYPHVFESGETTTACEESGASSMGYDTTLWQASSLVYGLELTALGKVTDKPFPPGLIAHISIQLHDVFRWLHGHSVYHNDVLTKNVMFDMSPASRDRSGLPKLAVTQWDWGKTENSANDDTWTDRQRVCRIMLFLTTFGRECGKHHCVFFERFQLPAEECTHDAFWSRFASDMAESYERLGYWDQIYPVKHEYFQTEFYDELVRIRDNMSDEEREEVMEIIEKAMDFVARPFDEELPATVQAAINNNLLGA